MLPSLMYSDAVAILALGFLVLTVAGPFLLLWAMLSVRRNLARIADSLEQNTTGSVESVRRQLPRTQPVVVDPEKRILNSLFGR